MSLDEFRTLCPTTKVIAIPGKRVAKLPHKQPQDKLRQDGIVYRIGQQFVEREDNFSCVVTVTNPASTQQRLYCGDIFYTFRDARSLVLLRHNTGLVPV